MPDGYALILAIFAGFAFAADLVAFLACTALAAFLPSASVFFAAGFFTTGAAFFTVALAATALALATVFLAALGVTTFLTGALGVVDWRQQFQEGRCVDRVAVCVVSGPGLTCPAFGICFPALTGIVALIPHVSPFPMSTRPPLLPSEHPYPVARRRPAKGDTPVPPPRAR